MADGSRRESWASRLGFILAAAGSAVGLGNIWRFPYVVGTNGGAIFVIIYLIIVVLVGYPMMVTESVIGRSSKRNPVGAFKALAPNSLWWIVGALGVLTGFVILSYYSVVGGWSLAYVFRSIGGDFGSDAGEMTNLFLGHVSDAWVPVIWHLVFMGLTVAIIAGGVVKGIQRWVTVLWPVMGLLILVLVIRSVTLEGAGAGLAFFLAPEAPSQGWGRLLIDAIAQSFFTLSLGMGVFITYGSYLSDRDNIPSSAVAVVGLDTGIAILGGLMIFPAVFALGFEADAGVGLTFMTLPAVFATMPLGGLFGTIFFILLSVAALTSAISLLEVVTAWLIDEKGWSRGKSAAVLGAVIFLVGIPSSLGFGPWEGVSIGAIGDTLLDNYDWVANSVLLPLGGLLTAIFAGWIWTAKSAQDEANKAGQGLRLGGWYGPVLKFVLPLAIAFVMIWGIIEHFVS